MCETRVLSQKGSAVISHCPECDMLNIWHQNLMLAFTADQFNSFRKFTSELDFAERSYPFPDGTERVILCTPNRDINFVFSTDEWDNFHAAMEEAAYMRDIYQMIHP